MKLLLATSNIMTSTPLVGRSMTEKSNTELINGLKFNIASAKTHVEQRESVSENSSSSSSSQSSPPYSSSQKTGVNGKGGQSYKSWTSFSQEDSTLYIPSEKYMFEGERLAEPLDQYDITVKLFYLPGVPTEKRCEQTHEAVELVRRGLGVKSIDLLIVSWPGVSLNAGSDSDEEEEEEEEEEEDVNIGEKITKEQEHGRRPSNHAHKQQQSNNNDNNNSNCNDTKTKPDSLETMLQTWRVLESLVQDGTVRQLGLAEFDTARLSTFLDHVSVQPTVNQIYIRDCCVVPENLICFAKERGIRLLTHNDCTDILPRGTTRELLSDRSHDGAGILAGDNGRADDGGLKGDVAPQWVVKYTAVVKDRGVIENKGYFAVAKMEDF